MADTVLIPAACVAAALAGVVVGVWIGRRRDQAGGTGRPDVATDAAPTSREAVLRLALDRAHAIITGLETGIVVGDAAGAVITYNGAALHLLGLTADQLLGRSAPAPDWACWDEGGSLRGTNGAVSVASLVAGQPIRGAVVRVAGDGNRWLRIDRRPIVLGAADQAPMTVTSFTDISREHPPGAVAPSAVPPPGVPSPVEGPFDPRVLADLRQQLGATGPTVVAEVIAEFLGGVEAQVAQIEAALAAQDAPRLKAAAHRLKGQALTVGLVGIADACKRAEGAASDERLADAAMAVAVITSEAANAPAHLRAWSGDA